MLSPPVIAPAIRRQIWLLFGAVLLVMIGFGIVLPILPFLAKRFGASPLQMGLLITGWSVAQFVSAPFWGLCAERFGRKPVMLLGLAGYAVAFVAQALATSYPLLLAARVMGGLLSSSVLPSAQALAADLTPPSERGAVMGLIGAAFGVGFLVGPALGGALSLVGPQTPFFAAAAVSLLAVPVAIRWIDEPSLDARRRQAAHLGVAGIPAALASPERPLYLMAFAATFGGSSLFSMLGYYAIDRAAATPAQVGMMFTAVGVGSVLTQGVVVGRIARRGREAVGILAGFAGGAAGFAAVALARSVPALTVAVCLGSVALAMIRPLVAALNSRTTTMGYGVSMGMQTAFDSLGRTLGPLWAGTVYDVVPFAPFVTAAAVYIAAAVGASRLRQAPAAEAQPAPPVLHAVEPPAL